MSDSKPSASAQPLQSILKSEEDFDRTPSACSSQKAVQISEPSAVSPEEDEECKAEECKAKSFRVGSCSHRLSGKPPPPAQSSSRGSFTEGSPSLRPVEDGSTQSSHPHRGQYYSEKLLARVSDWLEHERKKATAKTSQARQRRKSKSPPPKTAGSEVPRAGRERSDSIDSESSEPSFDKLQRIIEDSLASFGLSSIPQHAPKPSRTRSHRRSISRASSLRGASSDTDYQDGDVIVPGCDVWLDNTKTLGIPAPDCNAEDANAMDIKAEKDGEAWSKFKNDIIRIAHTLRLKGWRRIPLDGGDHIDVDRISGALTNAVYMVTPPPPSALAAIDSGAHGRNTPARVLLRIYGPQAEHLIDRENELKVLQRLARKKIGPRLLGTFTNGRFEQFFNAVPLTPKQLRDPETSKQIAKRMRELHEGIDLLPHERENGASVWMNLDQWRDNVARIVRILDKNYENRGSVDPKAGTVHGWVANGYVCGAPWDQFIKVVDRYRAYLNSYYSDQKGLKKRLVFGHNDTQYGNILRMKPDDEKSPLLQAANKHKQLIVIDFEYAGANMRGYDFCNQFTEWTYNYHDPVASWACDHTRYPSVEEQRRFIKAYVDHRPQFPAASATPRLAPQDSNSSAASTPADSTSELGTPAMGPTTSSSSIVDFMLDARVPATDWSAAERAREEKSDKSVQEMLEESRLWRPANCVFWSCWGIVQANIPGLGPDDTDTVLLGDAALEAEEEIGVDEFDYLKYTQDRALLFWGDCVQMGLVKKEDLPQSLTDRLKLVER